jgi:O-antigen ligase
MAALLTTDKSVRIGQGLFFTIFLIWISLFPQPVQERCYAFVVLFLAISFLSAGRRIYDLFRPRHIFSWVFLLCVSAGVFNAADRLAAFQVYLNISFSFLFLYFLSYGIFLDRGTMVTAAKFACGLSILICLVGISEWIFGQSFIYNYYIDNIYYNRYINSGRLMSTQFNPVILGSFLLGMTPLVIFLMDSGSGKFWRAAAIVAAALNIFLIIFSFSRGVFLGLCSFALFYAWNKKKSLFIIFAAAIFLFISLCSSPAGNAYGRLGAKEIWLGKQDGVFSEYRYSRILMVLKMVKEHPFAGVGFGNFRARFDEYKIEKEKKEDFELKVPDNMYLSLFAEAGMIGFSGFIIFIFFLLKRGRAAFGGAWLDARKKEALLLCMSGVIGLLVNMAAYDMFYWHNPFALFCILCGAIAALS